MKYKSLFPVLFISILVFNVIACSKLNVVSVHSKRDHLLHYFDSSNVSNYAIINWRSYFSDSNLISLIDTALKNNQELHIMLQEIKIIENEIQIRKGEYLPFVHFRVGAGLEKESRYTRKGAIDEQLTINNGMPFPKPLGDFMLITHASWELDIWKKLRNIQQSSVLHFLASIEGKNFMITHLIAEIAEAYYELQALDKYLEIIDQNINLQNYALHVIRQQKEAAKVSQLAVSRFEAQLLNTRNLKFSVNQQIVETENRINFLTARFKTPIIRTSSHFLDIPTESFKTGVPVNLLSQRPDIRAAELSLCAANLDVKVAKANFYPSISIKSGVGIQAFNPNFILNPESILYNLAGDIVAPLINRNAIKASYNNAKAYQLQAVFNYDQTILNAYFDVLNQISKMDVFNLSFETKQKEIEWLNQSISIANNLFISAKADYTEVLLTQKEALEATLELIEIKLKLLSGKVNVYRALGGGWSNA